MDSKQSLLNAKLILNVTHFLLLHVLAGVCGRVVNTSNSGSGGHTLEANILHLGQKTINSTTHKQLSSKI